MFLTTVIGNIFYVCINEPHYLLKTDQVLCREWCFFVPQVTLYWLQANCIGH